MGDVKHLTGQEAIMKMQELAKEIKTCMLCTYVQDKLLSRPMSCQEVSNDGEAWFLSDVSSNKNAEIKNDPNVEILFVHGHDKFMSLTGHAEIMFDKDRIKQLWDPIAKIWFKEGPDDPAISVIRFRPDTGYYWDTKHGRLVEGVKMATALLTGTTMDDGIEGRLILRA